MLVPEIEKWTRHNHCPKAHRAEGKHGRVWQDQTNQSRPSLMLFLTTLFSYLSHRSVLPFPQSVSTISFITLVITISCAWNVLCSCLTSGSFRNRPRDEDSNVGNALLGRKALGICSSPVEHELDLSKGSGLSYFHTIQSWALDT